MYNFQSVGQDAKIQANLIKESQKTNEKQTYEL